MKKEERHRQKLKKELKNKKKFIESDDDWQNEDVKPSNKYFFIFFS